MRKTITPTSRVTIAMEPRATNALRLFALALAHELEVIAERCAPQAMRPAEPDIERHRSGSVGDKR